MAFLSPVGTASYNGYVFNSTTVTTDLRVTPIPDRSGRTFTHFQVALTLKTKITGRTSDREVATAIQKLTQPAGYLVYDGRGVGQFKINIGGGAPDLKWGPVPKVVACRPLGAGNAVELTWSVEFATLTCADAVYQNQLMEFVWSVEYDIDSSGLTKRTYRAMCRVPQTRANAANRLLRITIDQFREKVTPALLPGFRRTTPASVSITEDKCGMTLTCVDEEFPSNVFPPGVVEASASHTISNAAPGNLVAYISTLDASYEVAKGTPVSVAWSAFFATLKDRVEAFTRSSGFAAATFGAAVGGGAGAVTAIVAEANRPSRLIGAGVGSIIGGIIVPGAGAVPGAAIGAALAGGNTAPVVVASGPAVVPWQFSASDAQIYGKTVVRMSFTYRIIGATFDQMLTSAGLWRPVPGSNWTKWAASVAVHQGPRGYANIVFSPGEDRIQDLCRPEAATVDLGSITLRGGGGGGGAGGGLGGGIDAALRNTRPGVGGVAAGAARSILTGTALGAGFAGFNALNALGAVFPPPPPNRSFLDYFSSLRVEDDRGAVIGTTLPRGSSGSQSSSQGGNSKGEVFFQQRTVPTAYVVLSGFAVRAGYAVPRPNIVNVNGSTPIPCDREGAEFFEQTCVANCGVDLYYAKWRLRYALVGELPRGALPVPENPLS